MAERSTARSADGAAQDHDNPASLIDSWIGRRSRLEANDSDSYYEQQGAVAPQGRADVSDQYQESHQPENTYEDQGRSARQRAHPQYEDEYEQYDGAHSQQEHAQRRSDPLAYQYDEHDQAYQEERRAQEPYGPTDASSAHEDAYAAQQERYAQPETGHAHEEYYRHADSAGRNEYRHEESDAQDPNVDEGGRPRRTHHRGRRARPQPASRRRRWLIPVGGLALAALLCALTLMWGLGRPPESGLAVSTSTTPPDPFEKPVTLAEVPSTSPSSATAGGSSAPSSATPSAKPSATPSATPSGTPSAKPTPTPTVATPTKTRSPNPVLLGPSSSRGVASMAQRYCDRYTGGSADPRNDGRWQCTRLLSASTVDMDVACRDTYDFGAYAQTSDPADPYAWRCYR
ncbi:MULTISPECIES: hypothetical protein [unclassified Micromonospora]|uniref:hypothetical protein n=1 Tax=unclassified Micromonospora TaxID=2617518 RepID=UPI002FF367CC